MSHQARYRGAPGDDDYGSSVGPYASRDAAKQDAFSTYTDQDSVFTYRELDWSRVLRLDPVAVLEGLAEGACDHCDSDYVGRWPQEAAEEEVEKLGAELNRVLWSWIEQHAPPLFWVGECFEEHQRDRQAPEKEAGHGDTDQGR